MKEKIEGLFSTESLRQILLQFLWWPLVVVGGGGGVSRVVWQSFERGRYESRVFHAEECIYNL